MNKTCKNCSHWDDMIKRIAGLGSPTIAEIESLVDQSYHKVQLGLCRFNPPSSCGFPQTREDDWCGGFREISKGDWVVESTSPTA